MSERFNLTTAVFLISDAVQAVACAYEADQPNKPAPTTLFKTFDKTIKIGDIVVVPSGTRHNMTTVQVKALNQKVDLDTQQKMDWIVGVVDQTNFKQTIAQEQQAIDVINAGREKKKKAEMLKMMTEGAEVELQKLPIANRGTAEIAAPADTVSSSEP